jgi:soluble lytic murein transglycosylase-like protein
VVVLLALLLVPGNRQVLAQLAGNLADYLQSDDDAAGAWGNAAPEALRVGQSVSLSPANANVANYLSRRYHVADDAVRVLVAAAQSASDQRNVDPLLVLAVMAVESGMNPFAQSAVGATGLMQVMPDLHRAKFGSAHGSEPLDPVANIHAGTQILSDLIERGGSVERGLQLYVGAGNAPSDSGYASRVVGELTRLRQAARGQVTAALMAAVRADQARQAELVANGNL